MRARVVLLLALLAALLFVWRLVISPRVSVGQNEHYSSELAISTASTTSDDPGTQPSIDTNCITLLDRIPPTDSNELSESNSFNLTVLFPDDNDYDCRVVALTLSESTASVLRVSHIAVIGAEGPPILSVKRVDRHNWLVERPAVQCPIGVVVMGECIRATRTVIKPQEWQGRTSIQISLLASAPMRVHVVDGAGVPVVGARVHTRSDDLGLSDALEAEALFASRWYWVSKTTDPGGVATFDSPPEGRVSIYIEPLGGLASFSLWEQDVQENIYVTVGNSYSVRGSVVTEMLVPLPSVGLSVIRTDGRWSEQPIQSTETDADGRFQFENVPADGGLHFIMLHDERYAPVRSRVHLARSGENFNIDLKTDAASASILHVRYGNDHPIRSKSCEVISEADGRLPISVTTDAEGTLAIPGYLLAGHRYFLRINLSGTLAESETFQMEQSAGNEARSVHVPGVGEVIAVEVRSDIALVGSEVYNFYPSSNAEGYCSSFTLEDLPVLLPAGPGRIVIERNDLPSITIETVIPEREGVRLGLDYSLAKLNFTIASEDSTAVELRDTHGFLVQSFNEARGEFAASVPPGAYLVTVHFGDMSEDYGPFSVHQRGLQLGKLDLRSGGWISGYVLGPSGEAIPDVPVVAYGSHGYHSGFSNTDLTGQYKLGPLPAGDYIVECAGASVAEGSSPTIYEQVFLGCNATVDEINFILLAGSAVINYEVLPLNCIVASFVLSGRRSHWLKGPQCKTIRVPPLEEDSIAGFWEQTGNELDIHLQRLATQVGAILVSRQHLLEYRLSVPLSSAAVGISIMKIRIDKRYIAAVPMTIIGDALIVRTNMPERVECWMPEAEELSDWQPLTAIGSRSSDRVQVTVLDGRRMPIAGALVYGRDAGAHSYTNEVGFAELELAPREWVWIDHSMFWAVQVQAEGSLSTLALRRSSAVRQISFDLIPPVGDLFLAPRFELGYEFWNSNTPLMRSEQGWVLPPLPAGIYSAQVLTDGNVTLDTELDLPETGAPSIQR